MGKIPQGILGGVSGKIGGVVGSSWKGINVIKTKPLSVANPKTAGQVAQRGKFSNSVAFAQAILSTVIKPLWDRFASQQSGYNAFIQTNIDLFAAALPSPVADLIISKGKMSATEIADVTAAAASNQLDVEWADDSGAGFKLATDTVFIVAFNEDTGEIVGFDTEVTRDTVTASVELSDGITIGDTIQVYLAFRRADGTIVSNTSHFEATGA